ncbi:MAG: hypothetical protein EB059_08570 [Alphaproteobacteria bacterium]|nr:hypothetical protein [Alphaproteobacteria bacterium]
MWMKHRTLFIVLCILSFLSICVSQFQKAGFQLTHAVSNAVQEFKLTDQRRIHILFGDKTGGGHKYGTGSPGKTEFPESWDDEKIITVTKRIANDNQLPMRPSGRRYWLRMGEEEDLQIRVVLDRERGEIVTSYPVDPSKKNKW